MASWLENASIRNACRTDGQVKNIMPLVAHRMGGGCIINTLRKKF